METQKPSKSISTSTPSFSIRYNAEEEEVEQVYDQPKIGEAQSANCSPQPTPVSEKKVKDKSPNRRSGSFEDGNDKEPWRGLFTEFRGRITKKVEEKLEEIKTERLIKDKMKKDKKKEKQLKTTNSLSDSEEKSEDTSAAQASTVSNASASSSPEKTKSLTAPAGLDESDLGDISGSEEQSSPERPSTPTFTDDIVPQRPRPPGFAAFGAADGEKKEKSKMKAIKLKFTKKKTPSAPTVEVGVDALEEEPGVEPQGGAAKKRRFSSADLPVPKRQYNIAVHKYPWTAVATVAAALLAYFCQKPSFLSGILVGLLLAFVAILWSDNLFRWISSTDPDSNFLQGRYSFQNVPFLSDVCLKNDSVPPEEKYYKGWMNELTSEYSPQTYHISHTETVYVKLIGSTLRLCTPKYKIPKRAFWSEPKHKLKFTRERAYDISRCEVKLVPEGLCHKRKWSRKYPVVINLLPNSHLGTRWAESKKNLLTDSDFSLEPSKSSSRVNELRIDSNGADDGSRMIKFLRRCCPHARPRRGGTSFFGDIELQPIDSDGYVTPDELETDDHTPTDTSTPVSGCEAGEKKSPTGTPTHASKEPTPPSSSTELSTVKIPLEASFTKIPLDKKSPDVDEDPSLPAVTIDEIDDGTGDEEDDEYSDFVKVSPITPNNYIILFARTAREKDLWFRRLVAATTYPSKTDEVDDLTADKFAKQKDRRVEELKNYQHFMESYGQFRCVYEDDCGVVTFDQTHREKENYMWFNIFLARILYDAMREEVWIEIMKNKIQKKLSVIRVPTFMEPIKLAKIEFSDSVPAIEWTHGVKMNNDGIWTEVEVSYQGTMTMTVDTKINLIKLKALAAKNQLPSDHHTESPSKTAYMDSSAEDSGETSTEESAEPTGANKALLMIDKLAASNFFQQFSENRIVKKALEGVSNTVISLNVQVKSLIGTLVLNIPPPPSDRLWYGFKPNVQIHMHAKPIFGERNINMHYITSMIEKTLRSEFQKVLVMPNMDDLVIPVMSREMPF